MNLTIPMRDRSYEKNRRICAYFYKTKTRIMRVYLILDLRYFSKPQLGILFIFRIST